MVFRMLQGFCGLRDVGFCDASGFRLWAFLGVWRLGFEGLRFQAIYGPESFPASSQSQGAEPGLTKKRVPASQDRGSNN